MELKDGYMLTEVGMIPEDWTVQTLGDISTIKDGTHQTPKYVSNGVPFYSVEHVTSGDFNNTKYISIAEHRLLTRFFKIERGDILMTRIGSIGDCKLIDWDVDASFYVSLALLKIHPKNSARFISHFSKSEFFQVEVGLNSLQSAIPKKINLGPISNVKVILPPLEEQEAIAEALSHADALIESLDQLIAKKRDLKQGAMQELLTGKQRLPGFTEKWEMKPLAALADIRSGGTPSTTQPKFWDGDVVWCTPTDITRLNGCKYLSDTARKISTEGLKASSAEVIPVNSIVMTSRATIGECAINRVPMTTNQGFKNFVPFENIDAEFLYYLLITQRLGFIGLCSGSTFLEIGKTQLAAYEVEIPRAKAEQTAIATILGDMDAELAELQSRIEKASQIKQGMMQELLTGRIRLL